MHYWDDINCVVEESSTFYRVSLKIEIHKTNIWFDFYATQNIEKFIHEISIRDIQVGR